MNKARLIQLLEDTYNNWDELTQSENPDNYKIQQRAKLFYQTLIIAIHGGKIELGTSEIALAIAGKKYSYYVFDGAKSRDNNTLHITASKIDEPKLLKIVGPAKRIISIHGCKDDGTLTTYMGGLDFALRDKIANNLSTVGFAAQVETDSNKAGTNPNNICNRGKSGAGVQLEITRELRLKLRGDASLLAKYAEAIRSAIP
jgi:phage replication-related protein YjqB (UPF0714/DUF867 family)